MCGSCGCGPSEEVVRYRSRESTLTPEEKCFCGSGKKYKDCHGK